MRFRSLLCFLFGCRLEPTGMQSKYFVYFRCRRCLLSRTVDKRVKEGPP